MFWRRKSGSDNAADAGASAPVATPPQVTTPEPAAVEMPVAPQLPAPVEEALPPAAMGVDETPAGTAGSALTYTAASGAGAEKTKQISANFGEIVAVLMRSKRHRQLPIAYLETVVVPAVATGQFAVAEARSTEHGHQAPVAVVLWANVSADLDRRIAQNPSLLLKLKQTDWRSGEIVWIVEAVGQKEAVLGLVEHLKGGRFAGRQVRVLEVAEDKSVVPRALSA